MTTCPTCGPEAAAPLFPFSAYYGPRDALWCPRCEGTFNRSDRFALPDEAAPPLPDIARGVVHGVLYELAMEPDGLVLFTMRTGPKKHDWIRWRATPEQLRRLGHAALHLASAGDDRQQHLRGADRWTFRRREDGAFVARIRDEDGELVPWRCAGRRPNAPGRRPPQPERCAACNVDLLKGASGYRPRDGIAGRVSWSAVRFCAGCVAAAPATAARSALRVIDGGAAKDATGGKAR